MTSLLLLNTETTPSMEVFRISVAKYADDLFASGRPARWNAANEFVLYSASSRSLAALEMLVRRNMLSSAIRYKILTINIKDSDQALTMVKPNELPKTWRTTSAYKTLRKIGSEWYGKRTSLILAVPSAVIPQEYNYIINTYHPDFSTMVKLSSTEDFIWDNRLVN